MFRFPDNILNDTIGGAVRRRINDFYNLAFFLLVRRFFKLAVKDNRYPPGKNIHQRLQQSEEILSPMGNIIFHGTRRNLIKQIIAVNNQPLFHLPSKMPVLCKSQFTPMGPSI